MEHIIQLPLPLLHFNISFHLTHLTPALDGHNPAPVGRWFIHVYPMFIPCLSHYYPIFHSSASMKWCQDAPGNAAGMSLSIVVTECKPFPWGVHSWFVMVYHCPTLVGDPPSPPYTLDSVPRKHFLKSVGSDCLQLFGKAMLSHFHGHSSMPTQV